MNLKKLLYFKTIVEQGQISRAARVLNMSQPPLSQRLKELEDELETTLIERKGNNWFVTQAGNTLYQRAIQVFDIIDDIPLEVQKAQKKVKGLVTIGVSPLAISYLYKFLPAFQQHAEITFRIFVGDSTILHRMLMNKEIDFSLLLTPETATDLSIIPLPVTHCCVVIPPHLACPDCRRVAQEHTSLDIKTLGTLPLMVLRRFDGGGVYQQILDNFATHNVEPHIVMDCPDCATLLHFLDNGFPAAAIGPSAELPERYYQSHVVCSLAGIIPSVSPCIAYLEKRYASCAAITTREALRNFASQINGTSFPSDSCLYTPSPPRPCL